MPTWVQIERIELGYAIKFLEDVDKFIMGWLFMYSSEDLGIQNARRFAAKNQEADHHVLVLVIRQ